MDCSTPVPMGGLHARFGRCSRLGDVVEEG